MFTYHLVYSILYTGCVPDVNNKHSFAESDEIDIIWQAEITDRARRRGHERNTNAAAESGYK